MPKRTRLSPFPKGCHERSHQNASIFRPFLRVASGCLDVPPGGGGEARTGCAFFSGALPVQIDKRAGDLHKIVMRIFEAHTKNTYEELSLIHI